MKRMQRRELSRVDLALGGYDVELHSNTRNVSGLLQRRVSFNNKDGSILWGMSYLIIPWRVERKEKEAHLLIIYHSSHVAIDPGYTFELFESDSPVPSICNCSINLIKEPWECLLTFHISQVKILLVPPEVPGAVESVLVWHCICVWWGPGPLGGGPPEVFGRIELYHGKAAANNDGDTEDVMSPQDRSAIVGDFNDRVIADAHFPGLRGSGIVLKPMLWPLRQHIEVDGKSAGYKAEEAQTGRRCRRQAASGRSRR